MATQQRPGPACTFFRCSALWLLILMSQQTLVPVDAKEDKRLEELLPGKEMSEDTVINFNDDLFERFVHGRSRPYHLVVFVLDERAIEDEELQLGQLRQEFGWAAQAFERGGKVDGLFFIQLLAGRSQKALQTLRVQDIPAVFYIPPDAKVTSDRTNMQKIGVMNLQTIQAPYPWSAEVFIDFITKRTGIKAGRINRSVGNLETRPVSYQDMWKNRVVQAGVGAVILLVLLLVYRRVVSLPTLCAVGTVAVFWFATSGTMYTIIRSMPLLLMTGGKPSFFWKQAEVQLGVEGWIVAGLYVVFSLAISFVTYVVPCFRRRLVRTVVGLLAAGTACGSMWQIWRIYLWKSGYEFKYYF